MLLLALSPSRHYTCSTLTIIFVKTAAAHLDYVCSAITLENFSGQKAVDTRINAPSFSSVSAMT